MSSSTQQNPDFAEISSPKQSGSVHNALVWLVTFIGINYVFLGFAALGFVALISYVALGSWQWAAGICALAIAGYLPSFFDKSELTAHGRAWDSFRRWSIWRYGHEFVGLRVIRTSILDPAKQFVFAFSPHGLIILSRLSMYGNLFETLFPGIECRVLGASGVFKFPGSREFSLWLGAVDASPKVANKVLEAGYSCIVYPGGIKEQLGDPGKQSDKDRATVFELQDRKGFIRLAIQHGAPLVPVVVFGERAAYHRVHFPSALVKFVKKTLGLPLLWFYGRFGTLLPFEIPGGLGVVFGKPIEVPHLPVVTKEDAVVEQMHKRYMEEVSKLWHEHKARFGYGEDEKLVIA